MKKAIWTLICLLIVAGFLFAQEPNKNAAKDTPVEKAPVTTAALLPEEVKEGKDILAEAQRQIARRDQAQKVAADRANTDAARLLAYDSREETLAALDGLQTKMNKLIARAQDRTGCKDCGIDLEKGTLSKVPPAK